MNYEFPYITNISDVLPAIQGRDEFVVAEKEGYTVINYNVMMADTFDCNIRRELRGIIFDTATGDIIRRPFHKFFNVNEREETQDHVVDMSQDHRILEKLDGSMIAPFIVNGQLIWGTKMGATDVAEPVDDFATLNEEYGIFARFTISRGYMKLKCQWYLQIHKAKEAILQDRNIVELILDEKLDDIKAHLPAEDRFELGRFEHLFNIEVYGQAQLISNMVEHIREENIDRKTFALEIGPKFDQYTRAAIFKCWDETDDNKILDCVRYTIRNNLTKTVKYEAIRDTWFNGVKYNEV